MNTHNAHLNPKLNRCKPRASNVPRCARLAIYPALVIYRYGECDMYSKRSFRLHWALVSAIMGSTLLMGTAPAYVAYPVVKIQNNTPYTVTGKVSYPGFTCRDDTYKVAPGKTWRARNRGLCLVRSISGSISGQKSKYGEKLQVTTYTSSGTAYAKFQIEAFGDRYRVFSENEYKSERKTAGKSPGFKFINRTQWPVAVSLEQVGCLHHGVVPAMFMGRPGVLHRDTGAVWFTLRAHIQPDGVDPRNAGSCMAPVAELIGDVAMAALTGGGSAIAKGGAKVAAKQIMKAAAKKAGKKAVKSMTKEQLGTFLKASSAVMMVGQYAGYAWPTRCSTMPTYEITGGPEVEVDEHGTVYLTENQPLRVRKTNTCGNNMMLASPKSVSAKKVPLPRGGGNGATGGSARKHLPSEGRYFHIESKNTANRCLSIWKGSTADEGNVAQWSCDNTTNLRFAYRSRPGGWFEFYNQKSKKCMVVDNASGKDGANIIQ